MFSQLPDMALSTLYYGLAFVVALSVVVFVHEYGHYKVARLCGITVDVFSIGFGKELVGWNDRHGTRWRVALLPLGGYVKFRGDMNAASQPDAEQLRDLDPQERKGMFAFAPVWARMAVVAAGPVANFIFAAAIFAALSGFLGREVLDPRVGRVVAGSAAEEAGFKAGDLVRTIDGRRIDSFFDIMREVSDRAGESLSVELERGSSLVTVKVTPRPVEERTRFGIVRRAVLGLEGSRDAADWHHRDLSPLEAMSDGLTRVWDVIVGSFKGIGGLVSGKTKVDQISGAVGIANVVGAAASVSFTSFVSMVAVISASIGLLNLLPIPVLDGGHLLFQILEVLRGGRPVPERIMEYGYRFGLILILGLAIVAFYNDIVNLAVHGSGAGG